MEATEIINLIEEEGIIEFKKALETNDKIEMLDSIADHLYVLYGLCYTYSFNPDHYMELEYSKNNKLTNYEMIYNSINSISSMNSMNSINELENIQIIFKENCTLVDRLKKSMLETKDIIETYITTMCLIINTYKLGIYLRINVDNLFDIIHKSNMSKLCKTEEEAELTVQNYKQKYESGESPYDSPYYYKSDNYYIVKNKSSGKSLKSINYTAVKLNIDELTVV